MKKLKSLIGLSLAATLPLTAGLMGTNHSGINSNKNNLKTFNGHFPGMGPYGSKGNQDHAWGGESNANIKFDLSTTSIEWINTHYTGPGTKGDTVWYGIYDFLTDAYPKGNFTKDFYYIKRWGSYSINTIMKDLSDWIGLNGKHENELALKPAYFYLHGTSVMDDEKWTFGINTPF